jgi:hypothetical protein
MARIAIPHPPQALKDVSDLGWSSNFVTAPAAKDAIMTFGPPEKMAKGILHCERRLGDSELTYYLQSRASGVNDM